ncbi:hypothetical protein DSM106972_066330 [Dulcicalothrix desertica PCC 7102]|uniref:DUF305 domain-containing protein n=1 Tax=Dulcicalothrix desertica PCC 7102 TaxID=232991 RepID=A0A433V610_9CYAN|nr:DUF305 domain-containing protein [Dulcicalothrix desertica]RUT01536.1 hypothetical protein DSM106972_066330 [Dulcicalothrix desertica PCC 7102]
MQLSNLKNKFFTFSLIATATLASGALAACSTTASQNEVQSDNSTPATETTDKQMAQGGMNHDGMNHGGMNHSMSMDLGPADANFDLRFIDSMIPHHEGAVMMAKQALEKSKRPEIKKLANDIIKAQNKEIAELKQWRQAWYPKAGSKPVAYDTKLNKTVEMPAEQMQAMMMNMDLGTADNEFDLRFINAMIPHHEGALTMGKDAAAKSKRPEIKKLAAEIISSQQAEISQMKQWRQAWYKK